MRVVESFALVVLMAGAAAVQSGAAQAAPATIPTAGQGQPALYVPWPGTVSPPQPAAPTAAVPPPVPARPRPAAIQVAPPGNAPRAAPIGVHPAAVPAPIPTATSIAAPVAAPAPAPAPALRVAAAAIPRTADMPGETHPGEGITSHALLTLPPSLPAEGVEAEAGRIRAELKQEVPGMTVPDSGRQQSLIGLAQVQARTKQDPFDHPQLVVVVDRNPRVQQAAIVLARPDGPWEVLGATRVSTGQPGRFDHYITPTGVFLNTADILGYRAEGTYNENHIRGLGVKGMRVWDFGWQMARKGWRADGETGEMRLEMHATDPEVLAQRIGRPASQGCIRIPDALNRFLDRHGVIDADYERAAVDDARYRALLLPNRSPTPLAGHALVVVDSSGPV